MDEEHFHFVLQTSLFAFLVIIFLCTDVMEQENAVCAILLELDKVAVSAAYRLKSRLL
jgi:hypothetical protein